MENLTTILWIIGIAGLIVLLFRFWYRQGYYHKEVNQVRQTIPIISNHVAVNVNQRVRSATPQQETEAKGFEFEKFVVEMFNTDYFTILDWRSDKKHNGVYPLSSRNPDIEYRYSSKTCEAYFAVECKWRNKFQNDKIQWAKEYQIENYRQFALERDMVVFVIIGVGGEPSNPKELYVVPLNRIESIYLTRIQLKGFIKKRPFGGFFLNTSNMHLS